jgi:hypothetical protein
MHNVYLGEETNSLHSELPILRNQQGQLNLPVLLHRIWRAIPML